MAEAAKIVFEEGTVPTTPTTNKWTLYFKTTGLFVVDDAGNEIGPINTSIPNHASNHTDGTDDIQDATGSVKGLATSTQITKLDGIETSATADQTGAEIKIAYEGEANTNEFSDAEKTQLGTVETNADVTDTANVDAAGAVMDSDISEAEGFLRKTGAGTYVAHKSNLAASVAPGVSDDGVAGYSVGSTWIDTTADKAYVCLDATTGAAVWTETTGSGGAAGFPLTGGAGTVLDEVSDGLLSVKNSTAADDITNIGHDGTKGIVGTDSGPLSLEPADGVTSLGTVGLTNASANQFKVTADAGGFFRMDGDATPNFNFMDNANDGGVIAVAAGSVTYRSENGGNTATQFGSASTGGIKFQTGAAGPDMGVMNAGFYMWRHIEANTAVEASPNVISSSLEGFVVFTNEGTGAENHHDLPSLSTSGGMNATFVVQDANGMQINAAAGDTIRIGATVSASGGFVSNTTVGDYLILVGINGTEWVAISPVQGWTFDT